MHIIPVIDLMHGQVVQAVQGQRQHYRPIQSQLTQSHALIDIVAAILQVYDFNCVYIADLNAITGDHTLPNHLPLIAEAMQHFPQLEWWVDAGLSQPEQLHDWLTMGVRPILASESLADYNDYLRLHHQAPHGILSLDFFQDGFHGPERLRSTTEHWTQPTIVMSLPNVGAQRGPDTKRIQSIKQHAPLQQLYAAGGVRDSQDIQALAQAGANGVLVASALHQGTLFMNGNHQ